MNRYTHTHTHTYTHMHAHMHAHIHAYIHACIHTYIHAYIRAYIHTGADAVLAYLQKQYAHELSVHAAKHIAEEEVRK